MAIYHMHVAFVSRSTGRSAVQSAAYMCRTELHEDRRNLNAYYPKNAKELVETNTLFPENSKYQDINVWNSIENFEDKYAESFYKTQKTQERYKMSAQTAMIIDIALPNELSLDQHKILTENFINERFVDRGLIATYAIHYKENNPHVHIMISRRAIGEDGEFQNYKDREICTKGSLKETRKLWADLTNEILEREGINERITEKSFVDLGVDLKPTIHVGWYGSQLGTDSNIEKKNLAIIQENKEKILENPSIILNYLNTKKSTFTQKDIVRELNKRLSSQEDVEQVFGKVLEHSVYIGENVKGEFVYTTQDYQKLESGVLSKFEQISNQSANVICDNHVIEKVLSKYDYLSDEQKEAVKMLTNDSNFGILVGKAGAGKTTTMKAIADIYKASGSRVIGMSLSAVAAENLGKEANIESASIASWLYHRQLFEDGKEKFLSLNSIITEGILNQLDWYTQLRNNSYTDLTKNDVIIVDEAGMVGTQTWYEILNFAIKTGAKVIAIGDDNQLKPIEAGDCFRGALKISDNVCYLNEIRRQQKDWQKNASIEFSQLNTTKALAYYENNDSIHRLSEHRQIAEKFSEIEKQGTCSILCTTQKECAEFNASVRDLKKEKGELQKDVFVIGDKGFALNDQIIFLQNDKYFDVKNGEVGVITGFNNGILSVNTKDAEKHIDLNVYNKIDHSYSITITKSQGKTFDNTIVVANKYMDAKSTYVAMTRHKYNVDLFYRQEEFQNVSSLMSRLSRYHNKDLVQDYSDNVYKSHVQKYIDLCVERFNILKDINNNQGSWNDYININEQKLSLAREILQDPEPHKIYLEQQGLTLETFRIQNKIEEKPLSKDEQESKNLVLQYTETAKGVHDLLGSMRSETNNITLHHKYGEYIALRMKRNQLARSILSDYSKYASFVRESKEFVTKSSMEQQIDYANADQEKFFARIEELSKDNSNTNKLYYDSLSKVVESNIQQIGKSIYMHNSAAHESAHGYGFQINHAMVRDYMNINKLNVPFSYDIAERASLLADYYHNDKTKPIDSEIANECIKKALCYELLNRENVKIDSPFTIEQVQNKSFELSNHIKANNIYLLNDSKLMKEALLKIDDVTQTQEPCLNNIKISHNIQREFQHLMQHNMDLER